MKAQRRVLKLIFGGRREKKENRQKCNHKSTCVPEYENI